jgi:hypothetical protein
MIQLTAERLQELLHYDQATGAFHWRSSRRGINADRLAGSAHKRTGYRYIAVDGTKYLAHRLAWLYVNCAWPTHQIDHINGDKLDNSIANLRDATPAVNSQNQRKAQPHNRLGVLGVIRHGAAYRAQLKVGDKNHRLGSFETPKLAHEAYLAAKRRLHEGCTI